MELNESQESKLNTLIDLRKFASDIINDRHYYSNGFVKNVVFSLDQLSDYFKTPHTLIYGDFNGLADLNNNFGRIEGTRCLYKALEQIQNILPPDTLLCRVGGDEFLFIFQNSSAKFSSNEYVEKIQKSLENSKISKNLTIELANKTSTEPHQLNSIYSDLQQEVEAKKKDRILNYEIEHSSSKWNALKLICEDSFHNFFKTFRLPDNYNIDSKQVKNRHNIFMDLFSANLSKSEKNKKQINQSSIEDDTSNNNIYDNFDIAQDQLELFLIYLLVNLIIKNYQKN